MALTPEQRTLRARLAASAQHAQGKTNTAPAREAFERRFLDEVDPDRELPEKERNRRAKHAMNAHMARLALKASRARTAKKAAQA